MRIIIALWAALLVASPVMAASWYQGGTLHTSPAKHWLSAPYRDKLATSADWAVTMRGADHYDHNVANVRPDAQALVTCVDEALAGPIPKDDLGTLAAACAVLMGW